MYTESIIAQLRELGSGEIFVDFAIDHISSARWSVRRKNAPEPEVDIEALQALRELRAENLAKNHALHCGCVSLGDPCMYNNGPCCCTADLDIGDCPFRQGRLRLDDKFVDAQMSKLRSSRDIERAEDNIRRARVLVKQMEEEINSSIR